ncbi:hypothetical protein Naga_100328g1 [Nannochloropsis gaditana]|uniref:Uncharacterized protein n=1 Tax=Nannochloropsis gaditana TaxID=72520 RepID=W7U3T6_9STRA|nr:hypothetical protein Naga_100328g1 [Nannochloropsis gaditana]
MASPMPAPSPTGSAADSNASAAAAGTGNTGEGQEGGSIGMETAQTCGSEEGFSSLMDDEMMINDLESFDGFGHQPADDVLSWLLVNADNINAGAMDFLGGGDVGLPLSGYTDMVSPPTSLPVVRLPSTPQAPASLQTHQGLGEEVNPTPAPPASYPPPPELPYALEPEAPSASTMVAR